MPGTFLDTVIHEGVIPLSSFFTLVCRLLQREAPALEGSWLPKPDREIVKVRAHQGLGFGHRGLASIRVAGFH